MKKILSILALIFLCDLSYADDLLKVRIDDFSGGQNSYDLASIIEANQSPLLENVIVSKKGQANKRKGQSLFVTDESNSAWTGIGIFNPDANTAYLMGASGVSVVRVTSSSTSWTIANPSNALTAGKDTEFIQANNFLFILNGTEQTPAYNGSAWYASAGTTASPPTATTGAWLRNYLFCAGNPTNTDWIYFSNNLAPLKFTSTDIIKVNTGDGQKIVKLETFKLNELIVYKEKSIFNLDITGTTPLIDWSLQNVSSTIGCIAPRSVVNVGNDHVFLSSDPIAVRTLVRSSFDKILIDMLSRPIQDIFDGTGDRVINKSQISKSAAVLFDDKYILAIPTGTSTVNDYVVVYDFITKSWFSIDGWFPAAWIKFNNNLYYIDANDGRVVQSFTGTVGDITLGPSTVIAASEPTVAITYVYTSKNIDFGNPENFKQLDALDIEFDSVGNYSSTIYIELDDSGWQNVGTINMKGGGVTLPANLPFTLGASGVARSTLQLQRYGEFKKIKIRVEQAGKSELCSLHSITCFARLKPWRREN